MEEKGKNLVSFKKALQYGYPVILKLPEKLPLLSSAFNQQELDTSKFPLIQKRDAGRSRRTKGNWAIIQSSSWTDFTTKLDILLKNEKTRNKTYIGMGKHYNSLGLSLMPPKAQTQLFEEKENLLLSDLLNMAARSTRHPEEVKGWPQLFKNESGQWKISVPVADTQTKRLSWINNHTETERCHDGGLAQQQLDF